MTLSIKGKVEENTEDTEDGMLEVTELIALKVALNCPHCKVEQRGFFGDIAGLEFKCDDCERTYKVSIHAEFP